MIAPAPLLLSQTRSILLLVDLQERLLPAILDQAAVIARSQVLLGAARLLSVPVLATEHCPDRIGTTIPVLRDPLRPAEIVTKRSFAATGEPAFRAALDSAARAVTVVAGTEAHVCVLQTVLGLLALGRSVVVVADAVGSRRALDRDTGLARMSAAGATIVTAEMVLFEWLETADAPEFRAVHRLIR